MRLSLKWLYSITIQALSCVLKTTWSKSASQYIAGSDQIIFLNFWLSNWKYIGQQYTKPKLEPVLQRPAQYAVHILIRI